MPINKVTVDLSTLSPTDYEKVRNKFWTEVSAESGKALRPGEIDAMFAEIKLHPGLLADRDFLNEIKLPTRPQLQKAVSELARDLQTNPDAVFLITNGLSFLSDEEKAKLSGQDFAVQIEEAALSVLTEHALHLIERKKFEDFEKFMGDKAYLWEVEFTGAKGKDITLAAAFLKNGGDIAFLNTVRAKDITAEPDFLGQAIGAASATDAKKIIQEAIDAKAAANTKRKAWAVRLGWGLPITAGIAALAIWASGGFGTKGAANVAAADDAGNTGPAYAQKASTGTQPDLSVPLAPIDGGDTEGEVEKPTEAKAETKTAPDEKVDADAESKSADVAGKGAAAGSKAGQVKAAAPDTETTADTIVADENPDAGAVTQPASIDLPSSVDAKVTLGVFFEAPDFELTADTAADFLRRTAADYWATTDKVAQENHAWKKLQAMDPKLAEVAEAIAQYVEENGRVIKRADGSMGWVPTSADSNVFNPVAQETTNAAIAKIMEAAELTGDDVVKAVTGANADDDNANNIDAAPHERGAHLTNPDQDKADDVADAIKAAAEANAGASAHADVVSSYVQSYFPGLDSVIAAGDWDITNTELKPSGLLVETANGEKILFGNGFIEVHGDGALSPESLKMVQDVIAVKELGKDSYHGRCKAQVDEAMKTATAKPAAVSSAAQSAVDAARATARAGMPVPA